MSCRIEQSTIEQIISFHGHSCPGLAIGIRAAEYALQELSAPEAGNLVCITETDMCGVDAIQFLTGCTLGKGNLLIRDYGKMAFSFYDRKTGKGIRLVFNRKARGDMDSALRIMTEKSMQGSLTESEQAKMHALRQEMKQQVMDLPLADLFQLQYLTDSPPRSARVLQSIACETCGEDVMESRTRRFSGKMLCIPCFQKVEQKI